MSEMRVERDSMGEVEVPSRAYYGAQTQRAVENFPVSGWSLPPFSSEREHAGARCEVPTT